MVLVLVLHLNQAAVIPPFDAFRRVTVKPLS